jgi:hypothetical protein
VVRAEDSRNHNQEDVGSNSDTVYKINVSVASCYIERKTTKVAKWGKPKKKYYKSVFSVFTNMENYFSNFTTKHVIKILTLSTSKEKI